MKWMCLAFALGIVSLSAEEPSHSLWDYHPIHIGGNAIAIGKADVNPRKGAEKGEASFRKASSYLYMLVPVSATSYFFPRVEWNTFDLDWDQNPKFKQTQFYYLQFAMTFYSTALEKWRWIARADYNLDAQHFSQPGLYSLWTGVLWGTYEIHRKWHYHVGATGYSGCEGGTLYPIIGADYSPNKKWTISLVFPVTYAAEYKVNDWCRVALKGRPLRERLRTGSHEIQPQSVFNYSSMGAELNLLMEKTRRFECELYAGYNFGGTLYIKDLNGKNPYYTDLDGAPYIGANIDYAF